MEVFKGNEIIILILSAVAISLFMMVVMLFMSRLVNQRSESKYSEERHQAELSLMRESFERRLEAVNEQLMSNDNRWREVNHLLISSQRPVIFNNKKEFSSRPSLPRILIDAGISPDEKEEPDLALLLTPFGKEFKVDSEAVKMICGGVGIRCVRGDEEHAAGDILSHVLRLVWKSKFVIANITSRNANVYYELGIAQALGKPVILITRDLGGLTFDLQSQRVLIYKNTAELEVKLKDMLIRTVLEGTKYSTKEF